MNILVPNEAHRRTALKNPVRIYLQYIFFALLFTGASLFVGKSALDYAAIHPAAESAQTAADTPPPAVIIDPGHGGEDGGASSGDTLEKDLNLMIAENICDLYTIFGYDVLMTRTEDVLLYDYFDDLEDYTGHKKTYDLRNRLRIAEESEASLYLGIHMNKFPKEQYKGLQVYYSANENASKKAANIIQTYAKQYLMPDNNREIKKATQAIYILHRIRIPAVLVECGFLSNPDELALLNTSTYRIKLASSIFTATAEYLSSGG